MRSSKVAIIASGVLSLFALATGGVATYAWFESNHVAETMYTNVVANGGSEVTMTYNYFTVDHVDSDGGLYFSETPVTGSDVKMGEYSKIASKYQLLLEINYSSAITKERNLFATTATTEYLGAGEAPTSSTLNALSSVIEFWSTSADSLESSGYYYIPPEEDRTDYTQSSFVKRADDGMTMEWDSSTIQGSSSRLNTFTAEPGSTRTWILFDYNAESIEYISYKFIGNYYLSQGLTFTCDFSFEV